MTTYRILRNGVEQWEGEASDPHGAIAKWQDAAGIQALDGVQVWRLGDARTVYKLRTLHTWTDEDGTTCAWIADDDSGTQWAVDAHGLDALTLDAIVVGAPAWKAGAQDIWQEEFERWCREWDAAHACAECAYCMAYTPSNPLGIPEGSRFPMDDQTWEILALGHCRSCEWVTTRAHTLDVEE